MDLGSQEAQPFLQSVTIHGAVGWCQTYLRMLVSQILHDHRPLTQECAIVQLQNWDVTQLVHVVIAVTQFSDLLFVVHLD
ncbi:hypothetical protein D9M71_747100 [compost metagenome]